MPKPNYFAHTLVITMLALPFHGFAQTATGSSSCDTCSQLNTLNINAQTTSDNTSSISKILQELLTVTTNALFGTFVDFGNTMTAFTAIPAVQNNGYADQQQLLHSVEAVYQGSSDEDATLANNYKTIFNDYLLPNGGTFDGNNASISTLYINPSSANYYSDDQRLAAQRYIMLASGAAMSTARKPSEKWLKISDSTAEADKKALEKNVSSYYTLNSMQSAVADNLTYIYGLNTGQPIEGTLDNYSNSMISESGVINYILSQKAESEDWYKQLKNMGTADLLREQTILLGGGFLMLTRIEEDLRRILVTNSVATSLAIIEAQSLYASTTQPMSAPKINIT